MLTRPALLQTLAVTAWIITAVGTFTGFDDHRGPFDPLDKRIWLCMLAISVLASLTALQDRIAGKAARLYAETTRAAVTRPPAGAPTSTGRSGLSGRVRWPG